jgi:O-antigen/teichoic acid export membrane protein
MDEPSDGAVTPPPQDPTGFVQIRHLARQSALLLSSGLIGYVGAFALNVLLARQLGVAGFGAWVVAWGIGLTVSTLGLVGADWILLRQGSYYHGVGDTARLRKTIHLALALSGGALTVLGLTLLALAPVIAHRAFHSDAIVPLLRVAAVLGPMTGFAQIMLYGTQAFKTVRDLALVRNLLQPFIRLLAVAVAVLVVRSPLSAMVGMLVAETLLAAVATQRLNRRISLFGATEKIDSMAQVKFALPVWGSKMIETTRAQLFPVLLGSLAAFSASAVFVAARRVVVAPSAVIAAMNQVYSPQASNLFLQGRKEELAVLFKSMGKWSFALAFPLFCLTVAFPKEVLSVFGGAFRSASGPLIVLSVGMLFNFVTGPVTTSLILIGKSRLALADYVVVLGVEVGLAFILIPRYGVLGAAIARLVGTALNNLIPLLQVWATTKLHPYRLDYWKPAVAGIVAAGVARLGLSVVGLGSGPPAAAAAAGLVGVTYCGLILLFGLSAEDRAALDALLGRARLSARRRSDQRTQTRSS